jgi:hypothetical protein
MIGARCRLGFERRVDAAIYETVLEDQSRLAVIRNTVSSQQVNIIKPQAATSLKGTYGSCVTQRWWSSTASFRATATTALFFACLPPGAAR